MPCSGAFSRAAPAATCGRTRRHLRAHPPRSTSGFLGSAGRPGHTPSLPRPRSSRAGLHRAFTLTRPLPQRQRRRLLATRSVTASHRVLRHLATRAPLPFHPQRRPLPLPAPRRPTQILDAEPPSSSAVPRSHILRIAHSRIRLLGAEAHGDASGSASGGAEANGDANDSGAKAAAAESEESESEDADAAKQEYVLGRSPTVPVVCLLCRSPFPVIVVSFLMRAPDVPYLLGAPLPYLLGAPLPNPPRRPLPDPPRRPPEPDVCEPPRVVLAIPRWLAIPKRSSRAAVVLLPRPRPLRLRAASAKPSRRLCAGPPPCCVHARGRGRSSARGPQREAGPTRTHPRRAGRGVCLRAATAWASARELRAPPCRARGRAERLATGSINPVQLASTRQVPPCRWPPHDRFLRAPSLHDGVRGQRSDLISWGSEEGVRSEACHGRGGAALRARRGPRVLEGSQCAGAWFHI